jgi:hypothetical protein
MVWNLERQARVVKADRVELHHIKYGLFNVDEWKSIIAGIITKKVHELEVSSQDRPELKRKIEQILEKLLEEVEQILRRENSSQGVKGFFRGMAMDIFDVVEDVKKGIPKYADVLLDYLEDPANREQVKNYLIQRFNEFADETAGTVDYAEYDRIIARYDAANRDECIISMDTRIQILKRERNVWLMALGFILVVFGIYGAKGKQWPRSMLYASACMSAAFLFTGISLPMIDIEATISSFSFTLIGEPVLFKDQVLFFQSKSILEVVMLLVRNGKLPLMLVSLLILAFSVLIPILKLGYSLRAIAFHRTPDSSFGRFMVFKSSKWSMADVMVVAIFMSYIGFNGVINSELTQMARFSGDFQVLTTNRSTLMVGFYLFTIYCIMGLLLASLMEHRLPHGSATESGTDQVNEL